MSYKKWLLITGVALMILLLFACSKDEENPVTPTIPQAPEFTLKAFVFPDQILQSGDPMAKQAIAIAAECVVFEGTGCFFKPPQGAQAVKEETGQWEYQWVTGGLTQNLKITAGGGRFTWQLFYNGSHEGKNYTNWRFMDVVQRTDQTNGHVYLYKPGTTQIGLEWVWYTLENGDYKFVKLWSDEPPGKIEFTFKPDKSGRLERFSPSSKGSLVYDLRITWNADGSGGWWTFTDGVQSGYGTWN